MPKICLTLTEKTLAANLEILEKYRNKIDLADLRVDMLDPNERFLIRRFPALAGLPVILTIRRKRDGGFFAGGESARIALIANALAYAKTDRRMNFAYIDIEEDLEIPNLEEAARAFGTGIIRSFYSQDGEIQDMVYKIKALSHVGDEIIKCVSTPKTLDDVLVMFKVGKELKDYNKLLISTGNLGLCTKILSRKIGSQWTYVNAKEASITGEECRPKLDPEMLCDLYRFRQITADTPVYGILGRPLNGEYWTQFFNTAFTRDNIDAIYMPFSSETLDAFFRLAPEINLRGASIETPHKQDVLRYLTYKSAEVQNLEACNTIVQRYSGEGWEGFNTDAHAFSTSILTFLGIKNFRGMRITIIGADSTAKAIAYQVWRQNGKALIINRSESRATELAGVFHFKAGGIDERSRKLIKKYSDLIINTTSLDMDADAYEDPLDIYQFRGHETLMDLTYKEEETPILKRAASVGCATINGYDMLLRKAKYQFKCFFGVDYNEV
ncbi:MAG: type I 3-dehydroquinate dehydratase [Spirochaetaceae bacterium]|jgi:3-dehydroquinate dehydratase/shikimate dehydrogenase|nr:type I 3-dehydroquinate dehydratase [Spirochaetaceae bacterium]